MKAENSKVLIQHTEKGSRLVNEYEINTEGDQIHQKYPMTTDQWQIKGHYSNARHYIFHPKEAPNGIEVSSKRYNKLLSENSGWVDCTSKFPEGVTIAAENKDDKDNVISTQQALIDELNAKIALIEKNAAKGKSGNKKKGGLIDETDIEEDLENRDLVNEQGEKFQDKA